MISCVCFVVVLMGTVSLLRSVSINRLSIAWLCDRLEDISERVRFLEYGLSSISE